MPLCSKAIGTEGTGHISGASDLHIVVCVGWVGCLILHKCILESEDHGLDVRVRIIHTVIIEVAVTVEIVHKASNRVAFLKVR